MPRILRMCLACGLVAASIAPAQESPASPQPGKERGAQVRFVFVSCLEDGRELVLATQTKDGWQRHGSIESRPAFVSEWISIPFGEIHLTTGEFKEGVAPRSSGHFQCPAGTKKLMAILLPDRSKNVYRIDAFDPSKSAFVKGSSMLVNYSRTDAAVSLGTSNTTVQPGGRKVVRAIAEKNGMYRMMVDYKDTRGNAVLCHDRYVQADPEAREILFLLPDETLGLRVFSMPEFGPFD